MITIIADQINKKKPDKGNSDNIARNRLTIIKKSFNDTQLCGVIITMPLLQ